MILCSHFLPKFDILFFNVIGPVLVMQEQNKNLLIVFLVSLVVYLGFSLWREPQKAVVTPAPTVSQATVVPMKAWDFDDTRIVGQHVEIDSPEAQGRIALRGGGVTQWVLKHYHQNPDRTSPNISLLGKNAQNPVYLKVFWQTERADGSALNVQLPDHQTVWHADHSVLTAQQPVTLTWKNAQGVTFKIVYTLDKQYGLGVQQWVVNQSGKPVAVSACLALQRQGKPAQTSMMVRQGPTGWLDNQVRELTYDEIAKSGVTPWYVVRDPHQASTGRGWLGFSDQYWLVALTGHAYAASGLRVRVDDAEPVAGERAHWRAGAADGSVSQAHVVMPSVHLLADQEYVVEHHMFAGPKQLNLLHAWEKDHKVLHLDRALDFGYFYILTQPLLSLMTWLNQVIGHFGVVILCMTLMVKAAFLPLSLKVFRSMAKMRSVQPKVAALNQRWAEDKGRLQQELMALYKKEKINPVSGCLPMVLQIPFFFAFYKVLCISFDMRHAPFWGWITDLSAPDPWTLAALLGGLVRAAGADVAHGFWASVLSFVNIGVWPILVGLTMAWQQKKTMANVDPQQRILLLYIMPIMFAFMMSSFPVGVVIYWVWSNILTVVQQNLMTRYVTVGDNQVIKT